MEKNLLQKEEEFHKLNAELELKTKELLKEVEDVMKIQNTLSKNENSTYRNHQHPASSSSDSSSTAHMISLNESRRKSHVSSHESSCAKHEKDGAATSVRTDPPILNMQADSVSSIYVPHQGRTEDEILPEVSYAMGAENITRVLRAKVKGLQNEIELLQVGCTKRTEECRKLQVKVKALEEDGNRWQQQAGTLRDALKKQKTLHSSTVAKLAQQEAENLSLKKELESLKKELRTAVQTCKVNEVRLNRSLEELEKLRTVMHNRERDDKELRDVTRKKDHEAAAGMRRLEKQKSELLLGFKKQMQLIDNLKKQKVQLQAAVVRQFSKEELLKLLDLNPSNKQQS